MLTCLFCLVLTCLFYSKGWATCIHIILCFCTQTSLASLYFLASHYCGLRRKQTVWTEGREGVRAVAKKACRSGSPRTRVGLASGQGGHKRSRNYPGRKKLYDRRRQERGRTTLFKNHYEPRIIRDPDPTSLNPKFTHCPSPEILIVYSITSTIHGVNGRLWEIF